MSDTSYLNNDEHQAEQAGGHSAVTDSNGKRVYAHVQGVIMPPVTLRNGRVIPNPNPVERNYNGKKIESLRFGMRDFLHPERNPKTGRVEAPIVMVTVDKHTLGPLSALLKPGALVTANGGLSQDQNGRKQVLVTAPENITICPAQDDLAAILRRMAQLELAVGKLKAMVRGTATAESAADKDLFLITADDTPGGVSTDKLPLIDVPPSEETLHMSW